MQMIEFCMHFANSCKLTQVSVLPFFFNFFIYKEMKEKMSYKSFVYKFIQNVSRMRVNNVGDSLFLLRRDESNFVDQTNKGE